jgi:Flp pilus assembly pilin Flp
LVEYALLCAFIAFSGLAAWRAIELGLGTAYQGFDAGTQSLAEPPEPNGN